MHEHLVFVRRYRRKVFTGGSLNALRSAFAQVCADFGGERRGFEGERDHVYWLVTYPPKIALARLMNSLKGVSSRQMRRQVPSTARHDR